MNMVELSMNCTYLHGRKLMIREDSDYICKNGLESSITTASSHSYSG